MKGVGAGLYEYSINFGPGRRSYFGKDGDRFVILLAGDVDTGKAVLCDYTNATIGFEGLSWDFDKSSKSLMRMFGPKENPQGSNLFAVIHYLQEQEGVHLEVKARKVA